MKIKCLLGFHDVFLIRIGNNNLFKCSNCKHLDLYKDRLILRLDNLKEYPESDLANQIEKETVLYNMFKN